ncbi:MAG: peptidylprolyl isomerase [Bacteroidota bacterium]
MKTKHFFGLLFSTAVFLNSLNAQPVTNDPVLMTVNKVPVYQSEFENIFRKNLKESVITKEALDEYLVLFTNFKLKVTEAEEMGLDTNRKFKDELFGYRKQLAKPYLVDNQLNEDLIKEAYERMKEEVRASHILIKCDLDADPKDTLAAWKKATKAREMAVKNGFEKTAMEMSEDPSVKKNKGDIGYFSAMMLVYPFESAAYKSKVGEVSMPVRTRFGYHILKVTDRRPARGTIKTAHILIATKEEDTPEAKENARKKAGEIYEKAVKGEDFATLARQYSDDESSSKKGGELPPFSTGKMVLDFENAAFALAKDGDISPIVQTQYGFHIIKRLEYKPLESFDELKGNIKTRLTRDSRAHLPRKAFITKLKSEYGFRENPSALKPFYSLVDTSIFMGEWNKEKASHLNTEMFRFADKVFTQKDFTEHLASLQRKGMQKEEMISFINTTYDRWQNNSIMDYEDAKLEVKYPEFKMLMKEYRDGILLFEITDQKVWSKAVKDSAGLAQYYEKNKQNYMWPKRYDVDFVWCANAKLAKKVRKDLKKGKLDEKQLLEKYNKDSQLNLKIESGVFTDEKDMIKKHAPSAKGLSPNYSENGQVLIIRTKNILEPTPKTITEAKGIITNDYQGWLEKEWLESLKKKYPVTVNRDVLYSIK